MGDPLIQPLLTQPTRLPKECSQSLEDILYQFGPITSVSYELFQCKQPRQAAKAVLPTSFPLNPYLFDYFGLFFYKRSLLNNYYKHKSIYEYTEIEVRGEGTRMD